MLSVVVLEVVMMRIMMPLCTRLLWLGGDSQHAECRYAKCYYAACHNGHVHKAFMMLVLKASVFVSTLYHSTQV